MRKIIIPDIERIETGALQVNDDFPGLFIRGDDALELEGIFGQILRGEKLDTLQLFKLETYYLEINRRVCIRG